VLAFAAFSGAASPPARLEVAAARFAVGLAASATYTSLPALARHDGAVPLVNGIMVQAGCIGALVGRRCSPR
jgi:hypothetical protein